MGPLRGQAIVAALRGQAIAAALRRRRMSWLCDSQRGTLWPGHSVARPDSVWPGQILCGQATFCLAKTQSGRISRSGQAEIRPKITDLVTKLHFKGRHDLSPHPFEAHGCHGLHGHHGFPQNPQNPRKTGVFGLGPARAPRPYDSPYFPFGTVSAAGWLR